MTGFADAVKKAFYLGVGVASYAGEKAGHTLSDLREQTQGIVNDLVARGEMTAEEAQKLVNEMVNRAQSAVPTASDSAPEPRPIEILDGDSPNSSGTNSSGTTDSAADATATLRAQVAALRQELETLKQKSST